MRNPSGHGDGSWHNQGVATTTLLLLVPLCVLVAAAYAAVGLGGGTGYLAVMTLFGVDTETMPSTALALNIVVTSAALLRFGIAGRLRFRFERQTSVPSLFAPGWAAAIRMVRLYTTPRASRALRTGLMSPPT